MIAEEPEENVTSNYTSSEIDGNEKISSVIKYIASQLPQFSSEYVSTGGNENDITQGLLKLLLRNQNNHSYIILQQNKEPNSNYSVDFGFYPKEKQPVDNAFFVIEAKRLPAPAPKNVREKEYVKHCDAYKGGIERFKRGNHGGYLKVCGIIGYIEENDFDYWNKTVNKWIEELAKNNSDDSIDWKKDEILDLIGVDSKSASLNSICHRRKQGNSQVEKIKLIHLWVKLF